MLSKVVPVMQGSIPKIWAGGGRISLSAYGSDAVLSELSSTYPLKLLSPRIPYRGVAVVYLLTYGGGLVGGDHIDLSVDVDTNTRLVLLSQGSTKVFKVRPGQRLASMGWTQPCRGGDDEAKLVTKQNMSFRVASEGGLYVLPEPVTCFESSFYEQRQKFDISGKGSMVVLDWLTSGRMCMGEEWAFGRYYSRNEVWVDGKRVGKDVTMLDVEGLYCAGEGRRGVPTRKVGDRLAPYSCYGMVILYGPQVEATIRDLTAAYDEMRVYKGNANTAAEEVVWSISHMTAHGAIVRMAGKETEKVKKWLGEALIGLQNVIGLDVYKNVFH